MGNLFSFIQSQKNFFGRKRTPENPSLPIQNKKIPVRKNIWGMMLAAGLSTALLFSGCGEKGAVKLDPKRPVVVTIWHYYNSAQKIAFDELVSEFNQTEGQSRGIIVESHNHGDISQLEQSILDAFGKKVGSSDPPNIFATYADVALTVDQMGYLADLGNYLTEKDMEAFLPSYLEEGRIGKDHALKIFPIAKSTEILMINQTDWDVFAKQTDCTFDMLSTKEGLVEVGKKYYEWTDAKTPDVLNDGKAFYGRDAVANLFITGSMQLGCEIFKGKDDGTVELDLQEDVLRRIWDVYYVPHLYGWFGSYGRFRSDDAKVGDIIALTGSTSSASYFPSEIVLEDSTTYPIDVAVLPSTVFEGGEPYSVQQGAGMSVTKSTQQEEYASVVFLKWFTQAQRNLSFSVSSGYLPVKTEVSNSAVLMKQLEEENMELPDAMILTLRTALDMTGDYTLYTNQSFNNGSTARKVLEYHLKDYLAKDLEKVEAQMQNGIPRAEAAAVFDTEEHFQNWLQSFTSALRAAVSGS